MGHVEITSQNDRLGFVSLKSFQVVAEVCVPLCGSILKPFELFLGVGHIGTHKHELVEFHTDRAPLSVVFAVKIVLHPNRLDFCEDRCAGVAFLGGGAVPVLLVTFWHDLIKLLGVDSDLLDLGLVQAQYCGVKISEKVLDGSLIDTGIKPIDIPAPNITLATLKVL